MRFPTILLAIAALIFLGIGVLYTVAPTALVAVFVDGARGSADARIEIRAAYGGIEFAIGAFFALGLFRAELLKPAVLCACLVSFGAGIARGFGMIVEGQVPGMHALWGGLEILGGFVAWLAYRRIEAESATSGK